MDIPSTIEDIDSLKIKEVIQVFNKFVELCESDTWPNNYITLEEITKALSISCFIEKCVVKLVHHNNFDEFINALTKLSEPNQRVPSNVTAEVLSKAADCVLQKCLTVNLNVETADLIVTQYIKIFGEERFQMALKRLIVTSASCNTIEKFASDFEVDKDTETNLKTELFLCDLKNVSQPQSYFIDKMLTDDENMFDNIVILFDSLLFVTSDHNETQKVIEQSVVDKMIKRVKENSNFWFHILKQIDHKVLFNVCRKFPNIFKEIILFLIHCSARMLLEESVISESVWITDRKTSLCPDLTYKLFKNVVLVLTRDVKDMKDTFLTLVNDSFSNTAFWDCLFKDVGIANNLSWNNFYDEDMFL